MGIDQWEWEGMGILIVFPHTSSQDLKPNMLFMPLSVAVMLLKVEYIIKEWVTRLYIVDS